MTLSLTNRSGNGLRHWAGRSAQQLGQQIRDAVEPAKIHPTAARRRRTQLASQPFCECPWTQLVGMKQIDQPQLPQAFGADHCSGFGSTRGTIRACFSKESTSHIVL